MNKDDQVYPNSKHSPDYQTGRGLTARDHIAIESMKSLIIGSEMRHREAKDETKFHAREVCGNAYIFADAIIEESNKS